MTSYKKDVGAIQITRVLYHLLKREICLTYYLMKSNVDAAFLPVLIFTMASLLYRRAQSIEILRGMLCMKP